MTRALDPPAPPGSAGSAQPAEPAPTSTRFDPWQSEVERLEEAARLIGLEDDVLAVLSRPKRVLEVSVPVRRDDGHVDVFVGWRIHHDTARGPAKGGCGSILP